MDQLVYPKEKTLSTITLILGTLAWILLIFGTFGIALFFLAFSFIAYLFAQSWLISYVKGNGVEINEIQYPDLYKDFVDCCQKLQIETKPSIFILAGNGGLNAFATRFLGHHYVVLLSDVVDAMREHPDGVKFYIGHELGHIKQNHIAKHFFRWPVLWFPLLGAAYSRACETTCDLHGRACSSTAENAAHALAALAAGVERWKSININAMAAQARRTSGFWMSYHELISGYPWLTKRIARVLHPDQPVPERHPAAYLFAINAPYAGSAGSFVGFIVMVYAIGIMAAVAIPAYQEYVKKADAQEIYQNAEPIKQSLNQYIDKNESFPSSLKEVQGQPQLPPGWSAEFDPSINRLTVQSAKGNSLHFYWDDGVSQYPDTTCVGEGFSENQLPEGCMDGFTYEAQNAQQQREANSAQVQQDEENIDEESPEDAAASAETAAETETEKSQ